jgi:hypothetical protein
MTSNPILRAFIALLLGGAAGASFCISVLPTALQVGGAGDPSALAYYLSRYMIYTALFWAAAGWSVTRVQHLQAAGIIVAMVGLISGTGLVALALAPNLKYMAVGGLGGLTYGYLGGLILGRILALPIPSGDDI